MQGIPISKEQFDSLSEQGVAAIFDCPCKCDYKNKINCINCSKECYHGFSGFFEARSKARKDIILVCTSVSPQGKAHKGE